jgi:hypothetical protein
LLQHAQLVRRWSGWRTLLSELGFQYPSTLTLYVDNQSAIQVAKNPKHHGRMKHLDLRFFWLRDRLLEKVLGIQYLPTAEMVADLLTNRLSNPKVEYFRKLMGLL